MASTSFLSTALTPGAREHFVLELVIALTSAIGPLQHRDLIKALGSQLSTALGRLRLQISEEHLALPSFYDTVRRLTKTM